MLLLWEPLYHMGTPFPILHYGVSLRVLNCLAICLDQEKIALLLTYPNKAPCI